MRKASYGTNYFSDSDAEFEFEPRAPTKASKRDPAEVKALRDYNEKCKAERAAQIVKLRDLYDRGELRTKIPGSYEVINS